MTSKRTFTAKNPVDLLAMVPYVLGFHPEDSIVLLTVGDAEHTFHARLDIPDDRGEMRAAAEHLASIALRNGVRLVALLVYCDDVTVSVAVHDALEAVLSAAGVEVAVALRADGSRWYSLTCCAGPCRAESWRETASKSCALGEGTPYDLRAHPLTAQKVVDGEVTLSSRRELEHSLVATDLAEVDAVEQAVEDAMGRFRLVSPRSVEDGLDATRAHLVQEGRWVRRRVCRFLRERRRLDAADVGRLLVAIIAVEVRDVAWAEMTRENARRHVELWRDVVRRTPHDLLAAPAALLAFAAWLDGDGALAWCAVERCQQAEPDYSLARLLSQALTSGLNPSTWRPLDRSVLTLFAR